MREDSPEPSPDERRPLGRQKRSIPILLLSFVVLCALTYFGWRFVYLPTTPQYAADRFFIAVRARDYDRVYASVHVTGILKSLVPGPKELRQAAQRFPGLLPDLESYRFGDSAVSGDRAKVETIATTRSGANAATNTFQVELVKLNGIWMIDGQWIVKELSRRGLGGVLLRGADL